jgi:hypothetical protein
MNKKYDNMMLGIAAGMVSPVLGFLLYGLFWAYYNHRSFSYFVNDIFINTPAFQSSIVSLSLLINLLPFFIFLRKERYQSARGVLAALFIYVPFVIYLRFYY